VAEGILPRVSELARLTGARVMLLRAIDPRELVRGSYAFPGRRALATEPELVKSAHKYLTRVREALQANGIATAEVVIVSGPRVPEAIADAAQREGADLIAVMSHGLGRAGRWVFGSVAEALLQVSATPILIVKASREVLEAQEEHEEEEMDRVILAALER
jgi:nucleotide-binding universal stress UspA family protein